MEKAFNAVSNIRFACVLQCGIIVASFELPRGLNAKDIILISEEIGFIPIIE